MSDFRLSSRCGAAFAIVVVVGGPASGAAFESSPESARASAEVAIDTASEGAGVSSREHQHLGYPPPVMSEELLDSSQSTDAPWLAARLHHLIKLDGVGWLQSLPSGVTRLWAELEYRPRLLLEAGTHLRATVEPLVRAVQARPGPLESRRRLSPMSDRQTALIKEANIKLLTPWVDIGAGWQVFSWGRADGIRPLEVLYVADYSDRLRDETLGVPSLSLTSGGEQWTLEGVFVPRRVLSRVSYDPTNVWSVAPASEGGLPVEIDRGGERSRAFRDWEAGLRVSYSASVGEIAVLVFHGYDHVPTSMRVTSSLSAEGGPVIELAPTFGRFTLIGMTAAMPAGPYLLRLDAGVPFYTDSSRPFRAATPRAVAGVERRYTMGGGAASASVTVQYVYDDGAPRTVSIMRGHAPPPFRIVRHAASASASVMTQGSVGAELKALVDVVSGAWLARLSASYKISDGVTVWAGLDALAGPSDTHIGRLSKADRVLLGVDFAAQ